jgi:hypothetical protein
MHAGAALLIAKKKTPRFFTAFAQERLFPQQANPAAYPILGRVWFNLIVTDEDIGSLARAPTFGCLQSELVCDSLASTT